jgi:hypothetical protein
LCSGTARTAEPSPEEVAARNKITGLPFFYLRGGCFPLSELKGMDKFLMSFFLKMLKKVRIRMKTGGIDLNNRVWL